MCRSIKVLYNFDPKATDEDFRVASLQYVRKVSGYLQPSKVNEKAFENAIDEIAAATNKLIDSLKTDAKLRNREEEIEKAKEKAAKRFTSR